MTKHINVTVPVEIDGETRFHRVGVMFKNESNGRTSYTINLHFPVGAQKLVCFELPEATQKRKPTNLAKAH